MDGQCPICCATNGFEACWDGERYEDGCPIKAEIDEIQAERDAKRAAEVRAGIMLPTDGQRDGIYSNGGPMITDHAHTPSGTRTPWTRCAVCGLAAAAHATSVAAREYVTDPPQKPFNPLGGAHRGIGRCTCYCGAGTDPSCPVHP